MNDYSDIINLEHYEPKYHKRMSMESRAAQFAPFSALTGYNDEIKETSRLTDVKHELDEDSKSHIDKLLKKLEENIKNKPFIKIIHFVPDERKNGGEYEEYEGIVKKIDNINKYIIVTNKIINYDNIYDIIILNTDEYVS